jgi:hypothetical protein
MYVVHTYVAYLVLSIPVTIWVARTLHKNGRAFLIDAFHGQETLADSVNHLLVVGFYLVNLGWIIGGLATRQSLSTPREAIELLSNKIGTVFLILGIMHFFNLALFNSVRRRSLDRLSTAAPPVAPNSIRLPAGPAR